MLKRQQVLLTDWQIEFIKFLTEQYDVSFSEAIRTSLCMVISHMTHAIYPPYKCVLTEKEIVKRVRKIQKSNKKEEQLHKLISSLYFEARKAVEYNLVRFKKQKKKK